MDEEASIASIEEAAGEATETASTAQHNEPTTSGDMSALIKERDEAKARMQILENNLIKVRKAYEAAEKNRRELQQLAAKLKQELSERDQQVKKLKSEQRQMAAEVEILMSASEESEKEKLAEIEELRNQLNRLSSK